MRFGRPIRIAIWTAVAAQACAAAVLLRCWAEAGADPVVVRYDVDMPGWAEDRPPRRIVLLSDTHVSGDAAASRVDPERLRRVVERVNALGPDVVVLGGDYVSGHASRDNPVSFRDSVAPFAGLRSADGVYAVLGNHDYELGDDAATLTADLRAARVETLVNDQVDRGGFVLAGIDDLWFGRADTRMMGRLAQVGKPVVLVSHNPDVFPSVPGSVALTLSGHTHGAQIVPPLIGPIVSSSAFGQRYRYGRIVEDGHVLIVTSGIGGRPLRWNAPPEIVEITIGRFPKARIGAPAKKS